MRVADQGQVVAALQRRVGGGADAPVGCASHQHDVGDTPLGQCIFQWRLLKGRVVLLVDPQLVGGGHQFGGPLPAGAVLDKVLIGMLHPDDGHTLGAGTFHGHYHLANRACGLPSAFDDVNLGIDHQQNTLVADTNFSHRYSLKMGKRKKLAAPTAVR